MRGIDSMKRLGACCASVGLLGAGLLAGCGGSDGGGGGSDGPYRIYASLSLSGPLAAIGKAERVGMETGVADVNKQGGIGGRKVELTVSDDGSDPTKAVSLLQRRLTGGERPNQVFAGATSDVTLAMCPIMTQNKVLSIGSTASSKLANREQCGYNFVLGPSPEEQNRSLGKQLAAKGFKRVGVLVQNDQYGKASEEAIRKTYPEAGLQITGVQRFAPDALDARVQLRKLDGGNPDVILMEGQGAAVGKVLESRRQVGSKTPLWGGTGVAGSNIGGLVGPADRKGVTTWQWAVSVKDKAPYPSRLDAVLPKFRQRAGKIDVSLNLYTAGYDAIMVGKAAAAKANSTDSTKMRDALEQFTATDPTLKDTIQLKGYPYEKSTHFSKVAPGDFTEAVPEPLNDLGQVPPSPSAE